MTLGTVPQRPGPAGQAGPPVAGRRLAVRELAPGRVHHQGEQFFLGRYVPVQRHGGGAELGGHPAHGHRVQPLGVGQRHCGGDDPAQGQGGLRSPVRPLPHSPGRRDGARDTPRARAARRAVPGWLGTGHRPWSLPGRLGTGHRPWSLPGPSAPVDRPWSLPGLGTGHRPWSLPGPSAPVIVPCPFSGPRHRSLSLVPSRAGPCRRSSVDSILLLRITYAKTRMTYAIKLKGSGRMSDELAIEASGLTKSYRGVPALRGIDLRVPRGTVFALLGPNGAGKTTAVRILGTLQRADGGQARVAGFDVARDRRQVRRRISLTGQFAALDAAQTGEENLRMIARLAGSAAGGGRAARGRTARAVRADPGRAPADEYLFRRPAPPARPGRQPGRASVGALPGRAEHRPGPAEPADRLAGHRRPGRRGRDGVPHHAVPGGGRPAGRPDRGAGRRPPDRDGHRRRAQAAGRGARGST